MSPRIHKALLIVLAVIFLAGVSFTQREVVQDRDALGLSRYTELKGAPPVLALTTVALGGFRGLISNVLWIRASELQDNDKYFEMVQLADWITKLEPHFTQVWLVQGWNMAYNISVKFKDPADRWRWVQRGIELLRDQGMRYNPNDVLMCRELAWFFQHKMGQNLDDAHNYYKQMWAFEMDEIFGLDKPNWDELIHPQTEDQKKRAALLTQKFKLDPVFMKEVDEHYGPLEWHLPEAHAIYWAALGLEQAKKDSRRIDPNDLITLRRVIYQSMQLTFQRGRLVANKALKYFEYGPNIDIIPKVSAAYEQAMDEDEKNRDHIETAHRNFLRDAVFFLYTYNREGDALKWFKYLGEKYPDKPILDNEPHSLPRQMSLDDYCISRINEEVKDEGKDKTQLVLEGLERKAYMALIMDEEDNYVGLDRLCQKIWSSYQKKVSVSEETKGRVGLPPMSDIRGIVLSRLLNGELPPEMVAILRTKLGMGKAAPATLPAVPETPSTGTNAPASGASTTNAPGAVAGNKP